MGKHLKFLWDNGLAMAKLRNLEIGIDAIDQLLIQFKLENVLNFVRWNMCGVDDKWK